MKKTLLYVLVLLSMISEQVQAQYFMGLRGSSYGGVTNVSYNPAIAGSRFVADINLFSMGFSLSNNYVGIDRKALFDEDKLNDPDFQDKFLKERINGKDKNLYLSSQIQGPLSFLVSFGKNNNNKNAIAFTYHLNMVANADGISEKLARISYWGVGYKAQQKEPFNYQRLQDKNVDIDAMIWADYGLTYSREIFEIGDHYLKGGITAKLVQGIASAYLHSKELDYRWQEYDTLSIYNVDVDFGHSQSAFTSTNFNQLETASDYWKMIKGFNPSKPTFAFDLGLVYEWRPNKEKYKYEMDGREWYRNDKDLYKLAAGFSITDMGRAKFEKAPQSYSFNIDKQDWYVKGFQFDDGLQSMTDTINQTPGFTAKNNTSSYKMNLPTRVNFWIDYNIGKGFGLNMAGTISASLNKDPNKVHHLHTFALTPRWDHSWVGVYLPFNIDQYSNVNLGTTLRLGPVIVGTSDLLGLFAKKHVYNADFHVALKVPIPHRIPRDRDKDKVSNRLDVCRKEKGSWESKGCPDKDQDGITDDKDECPDVAGEVELKGCPDKDKDGITDAIDECPDAPGTIVMAGCPDKDEDQVTDSKDDCPEIAGEVALNGCPDKDKDGVADQKDACPDIPGDKAQQGCPDTDGDGVFDHKDKCPKEPGAAENQGCPWPDSDRDGVLDKDDQCPQVPGLIDNRGCPKAKPEEPKPLTVPERAMKGLKFETGKAIIQTSSYGVLNELYAEMVAHPELKLEVVGHTDNTGTPEKNLALSIARADAVKTYLTGKGIAAERIMTSGFGDTRPIADNTTPQGKSSNRRVEMKLK